MYFTEDDVLAAVTKGCTDPREAIDRLRAIIAVADAGKEEALAHFAKDGLMAVYGRSRVDTPDAVALGLELAREDPDYVHLTWLADAYDCSGESALAREARTRASASPNHHFDEKTCEKLLPRGKKFRDWK